MDKELIKNVMARYEVPRTTKKMYEDYDRLAGDRLVPIPEDKNLEELLAWTGDWLARDYALVGWWLGKNGATLIVRHVVPKAIRAAFAPYKEYKPPLPSYLTTQPLGQDLAGVPEEELPSKVEHLERVYTTLYGRILGWMDDWGTPAFVVERL